MDAWVHAQRHAKELRDCGIHKRVARRAYKSERLAENRANRAQIKADAQAEANLPGIAAMNAEAERVRERERLEADSRLRQQLSRRENRT